MPAPFQIICPRVRDRSRTRGHTRFTKGEAQPPQAHATNSAARRHRPPGTVPPKFPALPDAHAHERGAHARSRSFTRESATARGHTLQLARRSRCECHAWSGAPFTCCNTVAASARSARSAGINTEHMSRSSCCGRSREHGMEDQLVVRTPSPAWTARHWSCHGRWRVGSQWYQGWEKRLPRRGRSPLLGTRRTARFPSGAALRCSARNGL